MATVSTIGLENNDGSVKYIYCHWDGYPEPVGVGGMLFEHYNSRELIEEMMEGGPLSSLGKSIDEDTEYYRRDRGETESETASFEGHPNSIDAYEKCGYKHGAEYQYLFTTSKQDDSDVLDRPSTWYVSSSSANEWYELDEVLDFHEDGGDYDELLEEGYVNYGL